MVMDSKKRSNHDFTAGYGHHVEKKPKWVFSGEDQAKLLGEHRDVVFPSCRVLSIVETVDMEVVSNIDRRYGYDGLSFDLLPTVMEHKRNVPHSMDVCIDDSELSGAPSMITRHKGRTIEDYCSLNSCSASAFKGREGRKAVMLHCQGCKLTSEDAEKIVNCDFCDRKFCSRSCIVECCSCGGHYCVLTCSTLNYSTHFVKPLCLDCSSQFALC